MANKLVVFPEPKVAEAEAYAAWTDANWPGYDPQDPANNRFSYVDGGAVNGVMRDAFNQPVVPFLGPPFTWVYDENVGPAEVAEPEGGEALRADGVLSDSVTWPGEQE